MKMLPKGGYLVTCSCSQHVSPEAFTDMLLDAARDAHRQLRLIESRTQGKDHPILLAAPKPATSSSWFSRYSKQHLYGKECLPCGIAAQKKSAPCA